MYFDNDSGGHAPRQALDLINLLDSGRTGDEAFPLPAGDSQSIHKGQLPRRSSNDMTSPGLRAPVADPMRPIGPARGPLGRYVPRGPRPNYYCTPILRRRTPPGTTTAQVAEQGPDHMFQRQRMPSGAGRGGDQAGLPARASGSSKNVLNRPE